MATMQGAAAVPFASLCCAAVEPTSRLARMPAWLPAGPKLDPLGARNVMIVQFAVITAVLIFLALWRFYRLKESQVCVA